MKVIRPLAGKSSSYIKNSDNTLTVNSLQEEGNYIPKDNLIGMLTFCVETTYFGMGSDTYQQGEGLAMGSPFFDEYWPTYTQNT